VTHLCLDLQRQGSNLVQQNVRPLELSRLREELAAQIRPGIGERSLP
jgi:hypothetical protein